MHTEWETQAISWSFDLTSKQHSGQFYMNMHQYAFWNKCSEMEKFLWQFVAK